MNVSFDIRSALKEAIARLRRARVPSDTLAAELLLMHAIGRDRAWIYTYPEAELEFSEAEKYFALIARRVAGEPVQYITGKQEFWGLEFEVTPDVLIPRPETEHVMEVALERLGSRGLKIDMATGAPSPPLRIADVCTGSGCLAVALAWELPHAQVIATDISAAALAIAARNAARHGVTERVAVLQADLFEPVAEDSRTAHLAPAQFDLVVSNPPYIAANEKRQLQREVRDHEPALALFGGATGADIYPRLFAQAAARLREHGILVVELGHDSLGAVNKVLRAQPEWDDARVVNDLAGIPRVLSAVRHG
ncbi:MAG: peptide chain release factor N(5)-glutamine methyltransferase [Candidatus Acidiferrales bacterium]